MDHILCSVGYISQLLERIELTLFLTWSISNEGGHENVMDDSISTLHLHLPLSVFSDRGIQTGSSVRI